MFSCSVVSDCLQPHELYPTRFLCPWDFPGKNTGVGCHSLSSNRSSRTRNRICVSCGSCIAGRFFIAEPLGKALKSIPLGLRETLPQTKWRIQLGASCMVKSSFCLFLSTFSVQFSSFAQSCSTLCDPVDRSTPGFPVHHQLLELAQTHVHRVGDAIQPSYPPAFNLSQHQGLFHGSVLMINYLSLEAKLGVK